MKNGQKALLIISVLCLFCICLTTSKAIAAGKGHHPEILDDSVPCPTNSVIADQWCKEVEKRTMNA